MLATKPSQHLESESSRLGYRFADSAKSDHALISIALDPVPARRQERSRSGKRTV
jgi:hypothetical protein